MEEEYNTERLQCEAEARIEGQQEQRLMETEEVEQKVICLKGLRELKDQLRIQYDEKLKEFTDANATLIKDIGSVEEDIADHENTLREYAVLKFHETGKKKLDFGLGVMVRKVLEYEQSEAFEWAKKHNMALQLNKSAFEKIAKVQEIPGVEIKEKPIGTIPSKFEVDK